DGEEPPSEETPKVLTTFSLTSFDYRPLTQDDGWLLHPSEDILLLNIAGTITALDSECPHNGCTHDWDYADSEFICTCHFSKFDREGKVLLGPAEADLTKLNVIKDGNTITVTE
ncbi:MAG: Rieske (2Fe-2S) protein, partial [Bacteroidota bacterium]